MPKENKVNWNLTSLGVVKYYVIDQVIGPVSLKTVRRALAARFGFAISIGMISGVVYRLKNDHYSRKFKHTIASVPDDLLGPIPDGYEPEPSRTLSTEELEDLNARLYREESNRSRSYHTRTSRPKMNVVTKVKDVVVVPEPKPEAVAEAANDDEYNGIDILALMVVQQPKAHTHHQCKYPLWHGGQAITHEYCSDVRDGTSPWCKAHRAVCTEKVIMTREERMILTGIKTPSPKNSMQPTKYGFS